MKNVICDITRLPNWVQYVKIQKMNRHVYSLRMRTYDFSGVLPCCLCSVKRSGQDHCSVPFPTSTLFKHL